ncbi:MAG: glycosyltransferase [Acidiferrobacterales bacterium]
MHIIFINPQGNFDKQDSYLTEHPDFGGQLVYVKEVAIAMAQLGHQVDIITRRMDDPEWPEFKEEIEFYDDLPDGPRIVRIACGGPEFLPKEKLWPYLGEFVDNLVAFYGSTLPDFATSHYADGGYSAVLFQQKTGTGFTFTGHSLGAQKLDKLGTNLQNQETMEARYHFSERISAERLAMQYAAKIITSTNQERSEQYSHPLYGGAVNVDDDNKFSVVPPGVNLKIFSRDPQSHDSDFKEKLVEKTGGNQQPWILVSSRLDEKKNIKGVVDAFVGDSSLQKKAGLAICIRGVEDPFRDMHTLSDDEQKVLRPILESIDAAGLRDRVIFLDIRSQAELAATYRFFAELHSVFALTAFYEPFGLAPIEAAATGLVCVATKNGGPSEIFADGSGELVDPFDANDIARGLNSALDNAGTLAEKGYQRVITTYTWNRTAEGYLRAIEDALRNKETIGIGAFSLEGDQRITSYLRTTAG